MSHSIPVDPRFQDLRQYPPFDRLTVVSYAGKRGRSTMWLCHCTCGTVKAIAAQHLKARTARSCGCLQNESRRTVTRTHGDYRSPEYVVWSNMIQRCTNSNYRYYGRYGGRGIRVCRRWRKFENFLADMGRRPNSRATLERANNNGPYAPSNCIWATSKAQARNRRTTRHLTHAGHTQALAAWAEDTGISANLIRVRIDDLGWDVATALTTPVRKRGPK